MKYTEDNDERFGNDSPGWESLKRKLIIGSLFVVLALVAFGVKKLLNL